MLAPLIAAIAQHDRSALSPAEDTQAEVDPITLGEVTARLLALLAESDPEAELVAAEQAPLLQRAYPEDYDAMMKEIRNYDLETAYRILEAARAKQLAASADAGTGN